MKRVHCTEMRRGRQRGDALLEALVAIVLAAVVGLGLAYAATRIAHGQRFMSTQNLAVHDMREGLLQKGFVLSDLCDDSSLHSHEAPERVALFSLNCENTTVTVNGQDVSLSVVRSLSSEANDRNSALLGGDGVVTLSME